MNEANRAERQEQSSTSRSDSSTSLRPAELVLQAMLPFENTTQTWRERAAPKNLMAEDEICRILLLEPLSTLGKLIISISHDDYVNVPGGVQLCIQREQALAAKGGVRYLHLRPWNPVPRLAHAQEDPDPIVALTLDGNTLGACRMSTMIRATQKMKVSWSFVSVVVHHLLGHLPEQIIELIHATGSNSCVFWLHDYFSICPNYKLQRNDLAFCSGPPITSNACFLCVYGKERQTHHRRMKAFFEALRVNIASPSAVTADLWQSISEFEAASIDVLPHMTLGTVPRVKAMRVSQDDRPITVGYLGAQVDHKGWPVFVSLMHEHLGSGNYRFVVLSNKKPNIGEDAWVSVKVSSANPDAMSQAVNAQDIDIVLHWPTWPETFSFTTFEALAGSAFVLTNSGSGNVAAAVNQTKRGIVLNDESELVAFFKSGHAKTLAKQRRKENRNFEMTYSHSGMSFPLIERS